VKASDIQTVSDIEILNPDLVICTLDEGASLAWS
jgi:DNA-directed RNA polymerase subunit alpha